MGIIFSVPACQINLILYLYLVLQPVNIYDNHHHKDLNIIKVHALTMLNVRTAVFNIIIKVRHCHNPSIVLTQ